VTDHGQKIFKDGDRTKSVVLHPLLRAMDASILGPCPIQWDIRCHYSSATTRHVPHMVNSDFSQAATFPPSRHMVLVSQSLPWPITIARFSNIRVEDVLSAIFKTLQEEMTVGEYYLQAPSDRTRVEEYLRKPGAPRRKPGEWLRVDQMCNTVKFSGLINKDAVIKERMVHDPDEMDDAWVVVLRNVS